ncbi:MAG: hypothetical protein CVU11_16770 [Bacteroidetes bacterium HGW-Bacteroidetes-6]|jgi:hypothetical protein|nr:MAG: hypothetical protein CVU11_16770 [Bacteroidetes bacterium HGW-Bacteroidetes-6]
MNRNQKPMHNGLHLPCIAFSDTSQVAGNPGYYACYPHPPLLALRKIFISSYLNSINTTSMAVLTGKNKYICRAMSKTTNV